MSNPYRFLEHVYAPEYLNKRVSGLLVATIKSLSYKVNLLGLLEQFYFIKRKNRSSRRWRCFRIAIFRRYVRVYKLWSDWKCDNSPSKRFLCLAWISLWSVYP